jgi:hypothetical protein
LKLHGKLCKAGAVLQPELFPDSAAICFDRFHAAVEHSRDFEIGFGPADQVKHLELGGGQAIYAESIGVGSRGVPAIQDIAEMIRREVQLSAGHTPNSADKLLGLGVFAEVPAGAKLNGVFGVNGRRKWRKNENTGFGKLDVDIADNVEPAFALVFEADSNDVGPVQADSRKSLRGCRCIANDFQVWCGRKR